MGALLSAGFLAAGLRGTDDLVHVVKLVGRVERVGGSAGALGGDVRPGHQGAHDGGAVCARAVELAHPLVAPAKSRIVVEAHPHAVGGKRGRCRDGCDDAQDGDQACTVSHGHLLLLGCPFGVTAAHGSGRV